MYVKLSISVTKYVFESISVLFEELIELFVKTFQNLECVFLKEGELKNF